MVRNSCAVTLIVALATASAAAQQAAEQNSQTQTAAAATALPPPPPQEGGGFVDKAKRWADEHQLLERLNGDVDGWYPRLGGMTRGGGFAFGPGYRFHVNDVLV